MLTRIDRAILIAQATGRPVKPAARIVDEVLARAGYSRTARRKLIADARSVEAHGAPDFQERNAP